LSSLVTQISLMGDVKNVSVLAILNTAICMQATRLQDVSNKIRALFRTLVRVEVNFYKSSSYKDFLDPSKYVLFV